MVRQWLQATSNWQRAWPQAPPETTVMSESTPMIPPSPARSMSGVLTRTPMPCNNPCGMKRGEALARKASTPLPRFLKCPLQFDPMAMDHKQLSDADSTKFFPVLDEQADKVKRLKKCTTSLDVELRVMPTRGELREALLQSNIKRQRLKGQVKELEAQYDLSTVEVPASPPRPSSPPPCNSPPSTPHEKTARLHCPCQLKAGLCKRSFDMLVKIDRVKCKEHLAYHKRSKHTNYIEFEELIAGMHELK
jgi:hypothetical protein